MMDAGYSRAEVYGIYLEELPNVIRAVKLRKIDKAGEVLLMVSMTGFANDRAIRAMERELGKQATYLGRRLPSAMDAAGSEDARRKIAESKKRLKEQAEARKAEK